MTSSRNRYIRAMRVVVAGTYLFELQRSLAKREIRQRYRRFCIFKYNSIEIQPSYDLPGRFPGMELCGPTLS